MAILISFINSLKSFIVPLKLFVDSKIYSILLYDGYSTELMRDCFVYLPLLATHGALLEIPLMTLCDYIGQWYLCPSFSYLLIDKAHVLDCVLFP